MMLRRPTIVPRNRVLVITLLFALAMIVPLAGCGGAAGDDVDAAENTEGQAATDSDREMAPEFTLSDLAGEEFSLASTAGEVLLIDFWATWCAPCREELPMLQRLNDTYREQGFRVVGVSDESADVLRDFLEEEGISYKNLVDHSDVASEFMVLGLPTGFLIDREGQIVERYSGPKPVKILERRIQELLAEKPAEVALNS